jgi:putative endonuclease
MKLSRLTRTLLGRGPRAGGERTRVRAAHLALGARGEMIAAGVLERAGYRLVAANFRLPVGRNLRGAIVRAEIDLVAYDGPVLCFVEVKTRASDRFAAPEANVDLRKQRQIARAARAYRRAFGLADAPHRYDVVSVILPPTRETRDGATRRRDGVTRVGEGRVRDERLEADGWPRVELLKNFWTDEKFRKRRWSGAG